MAPSKKKRRSPKSPSRYRATSQSNGIDGFIRTASATELSHVLQIISERLKDFNGDDLPRVRKRHKEEAEAEAEAALGSPPPIPAGPHSLYKQMSMVPDRDDLYDPYRSNHLKKALMRARERTRELEARERDSREGERGER